MTHFRLRHLGLAFLLIPLLLPLAGCSWFAPRSQQMRRSLGNHQYPSEPVGTPAFEAALDRYTGSVARPGNAARLLQDGEEAYPAMLDLIASATTRISLETYIVENDDTTNRFFDALKEAAARGVEVRVLVDAAGFRRGKVAQLRELSSHGIQARVFNPMLLSWTIFRVNNRDHRKILVVDGRHAVVGGINLSDHQAGNGIDGWRDTALLIAGPTAADAEQVFAETWEQAGRAWFGRNLPVAVLNPVKQAADAPFLDFRDNILGRPAFVPPPPAPPDPAAAPYPEPAGGYQTPDARVRMVSSSPDRHASPTYDLAILGLWGARERADAAMAYFVPPLGLRRALVAAAERGVAVRLLLPGVTDVALVREMGVRHYGELLRAGVRIYEWPHPILHAKTMAVDGRWLMAGSANMDSRSYFLNYEADLAATDPALAEAAHRKFEEDLGQAREVTLEEWKARGAWARLKETLLIPLSGQY